MSYQDQVDIAEQLLQKIEIPMLPNAVLELQKLFSDSDIPSPSKLTQLISSNPFLAGELILLANLPSLSNGNQPRVKDINSAIHRLGTKQIKNYVMSIYAKKMLGDRKIEGLSYHSQDIAIIASAIARKIRNIGPDEAYLLGLIHDIGTFALNELDEIYGQTFVGKLINYSASERSEYERYGTTHSALGYVITRAWRVPNYLSQAILLHHIAKIPAIKNAKLRQLVALIELSHTISFRKTHQGKETAANIAIYQECIDILEISEETLSDILAQIQ